MTIPPEAPTELFERPSILGNNAIPSMLEIAPAKRVLTADLARFLTVLKVSNSTFKIPALTMLIDEIEFAWASVDSATRRDAIAMAEAQSGGMKLAKPLSIVQTGLSGGKK